MKNIDEALRNVDMTYAQLVEVANEIVAKCTPKVDAILKKINDVENLSNDTIRSVMLELSLAAYGFSEIKEKSAMKAECAEILRKEKYAQQFNLSSGAVATKENTAMLSVSEEVLAETIFNLVASTLKVKLDEIHRVVDTLKSVIASRLAEAKLTAIADNGQES